MSLINLYLRKETRKGCKGVAYYRDPDATIQVCFNQWESRPDKRFKYVMLNCARYRAVWLDDLPKPPPVTTAQEIRDAIDSGHDVRLDNDGYKVTRDSVGQYLITYAGNGYCIGLTHQDGVTLNGHDFYVRNWP